jgi:UTP--glucose-1-phosphate uridylyltransferase
MQHIRKAIFPVAGLGTRFLPATKASPKEMMPVVDKPLIQYAVEEAIAAGCTQMIFVTSGAKRAIEDHFDKNFELETKLAQKHKKALLEVVHAILPQGIECVYVRQQEALGLGHAVLCARHLIGDEPVAVLLADDLIDADTPCLKQMADQYAKTPGGILAVQQVPKDQTDQYGIVSVDDESRIAHIVEKPAPKDAPSTQAVVGRYILPPSIFDALEHVQQGAGGEVQLTDAIAAMLQAQPFYAHAFEGKRFDCGSKLGYLKANVEFGLKHPECGKSFQKYIKGLQA